MRTSKKTALAAAAALIAAAPFARSQTSPTGDIVTITSQKRTENIREVPLSVTAISGDSLQDNHVADFVDLARVVPNLSFSTQAGPGLATLELRGVSSQAGSATVSIYLDDVSLTTRNLYSQGSAEPRFFDVERVEVLRGPQGTLYGASSLGGTIKFISNQPDARQLAGGAYAELSGTEHGGTNYKLQGVLNVPLVKDSLALRIGVQSGRDSGYIDQVDPATLAVVGKGINDNRWNVAKLALKAQLGSDWTLTPALFFQRVLSGDIDASYTKVGDYQSANVGAPLAPFQTSKIVREPGRDTLSVPSATLTGNLGFADLTGVLSGYNRNFSRVQDGTSINSSYLGSPGVITDPALAATVGFLPSAVDLNNYVSQTSLELRLASKDHVAGGNPFTWIGGLYLAKTKTQVYDNEPIFGINAAFSAAGQDINDPNAIADSFPGAFAGDSSYYSARHYDDRQNAIFGEATYHASDALRLIVGLRVLRATEHFTREGNYYYAGGPSSALIDSSAKATTPHFAVDWDLDPNNTLYVNVAKGFRLGAANRPVPLTPLVQQDLQTLGLPGTIPAAFQPDSLWSYEAGTKSRLLGGNLWFTAAAFYIDWSNIQQDVTLPTSGFDFETNVGKARSLGLEFEARLHATKDLTLTASGSITNATFASDTPALGTDAAGQLNVRKGDRVQGVPRFNAALGFDYHFSAFGTEGGFVRANGQWVGSSRGSFVRDSSDYERPGYFTADAALGATFDRWEVSAFVKNALNNSKVIQRPDIQGVPEVYQLRPRTIGVTARYDF